MVLLNPTILLGLLAASIPLILHFLNLRKIKKVEFSTLAFLKELQKSKVRKIKIKQLLLLLIRILIIVFLVLAFARPTLETTTIGGISSNAKTTAIIIVDNSFSMSVVDEKGSFLNQSKVIVGNLISSFESGDEVYLILTSEGKSKSYPTTQNIEAVGISFITSSLSKSLKIASEITSETKNLNKEVYIFSDLQKSTFFENDSLSENFNFSETKFYLFHFKSESVNNLAVTNLKLNNQIFELNKEVGITSEITNFSNANIVNRLNSLSLNGKRVAQKSISVDGKQTISEEYQATPDITGIIEIETNLEDDAIKHDNSFYSYISIPDKINVLLISNLADELLFVKSALMSNYSTSIDLQSIKPSELRGINLDNYNSLIISGAVDDNYLAKIVEYISGGGNVILFPSPNPILHEENKFLSLLNMAPINRLATSENRVSINTFDKIDFNHAIFNGIFAEKTQEIESPTFYKYYKYSPSGTGRTIIQLQDNSSFLSEYRLNKGKILFFNTCPILEWSNFPFKNIFAPLMNRSISYLASNFSNDESNIAGRNISVNISKRKSNQIKIVRPDGSEELINIGDEKTIYLNYSNTNLVGIYKFYSNNILLDIKVVNFNSSESNLETISAEIFSGMVEKESNVVFEISSSDDYKAKIASSRYGSELWKLFLILTLALALLEMYISRSSKKDLAEL
ncbi:MAG: BatA and WFA domain-containing protein [Bacteroidetes bacterium]|nr:BatA and WFA domain-containing protein [Bacteroidota bacterium]MBU1116852.1 BatA and WFA domain-containing protein [Bacteroidota bacterium]MBU1798039.1 BatA and WFA domain-containing protein [Bacteroidota bacterium]